MKIRDVVVLDEVTHDLIDGKLFYDESEIVKWGLPHTFKIA